MTTSTTETKPSRRPRRRAAAVVAVLLLLVGVGLLLFSYLSWLTPAGQSAPSVVPTTSLSPVAQTQTVAASPLPTPGGTGLPPVVVTRTTYVAVTKLVTEPASSPADSGLLAMVTTVSGLLASVAGIVSAVVSVRGNRPR